MSLLASDVSGTNVTGQFSLNLSTDWNQARLEIITYSYGQHP